MKFHKLSTKLFILSGLLCYIVLLCSAPLLHKHTCYEYSCYVHDHDHDHEHKHCDQNNHYDQNNHCDQEDEEEQNSHTNASCAACAIINTQFTFEYQSNTLSYNRPCDGKVPVFEICFIDIIPTRNIHSRAPPDYVN